MEIVNDVITDQKINLIDGTYTPSEAAHIVNSVLKVKINFHKLHRLSIQEGNELDECKLDSGRIKELIDEQEISKAFFSQARLQGKKLKMSSIIHIEIEE